MYNDSSEIISVSAWTSFLDSFTKLGYKIPGNRDLVIKYFSNEFLEELKWNL
jgi:hypothetical protein